MQNKKKRRVRHHVNPLADQTEVVFEGFGNDKNVIVDVGADRGEFTEGLLAHFGDTKNFLVLEIRKPLAEKLRAKFSEYDNVRVFDGDAVRNFRALLEPCMKEGAHIETIYVNFPDPWFKDRHKKRRFICERLFEDVQTWMTVHTAWVYQTDQKALFDDTVELLGEQGITEITFFEESPYNVKTKWEMAKIEDGDPIHRMSFHLQNDATIQ